MAKKNVTLELTAAEYKLYNAFLATNRVIQQTGNNLGGLADKTNQVGRGASMGLAGIARQAVATGAAFAGIGTALQGLARLAEVLKNELRATEAFKRTAAERGVEFQKVMRQISWQLPRMDPSVMDMTIEEIRESILQSKGPNKVALAEGVLASISASVGAKLSESTYAALKFGEAREEVMTGEAMQAAMQAIRAHMTAYKTTFEETVGILAAAQTSSYITDPQKFFTAAGQLAGAQGFGMSQQTAFSLMSAIGTRMADRMGELTVTGVMNLGRDVYTAAGKIDPSLLQQSWLEMNDAVRSETATRRHMLGVLDMSIQGEANVRSTLSKMEREGGMDPHIRTRAKGLISKTEWLQAEAYDTFTKQLFRAAQRAIPTPETAAGFFQRTEEATKLQQADLGLQMYYAGERARATAALMPGAEGMQMAGHFIKLLEEAPEQLGVDTAFAASVRAKVQALKTMTRAEPGIVLEDALAWVTGRAEDIRGRTVSPVPGYTAFRGAVGMRAGAPIRELSIYEQAQLQWLESLRQDFIAIGERMEKIAAKSQGVVIEEDKTRVTPGEPAPAPAAAIGESP